MTRKQLNLLPNKINEEYYTSKSRCSSFQCLKVIIISIVVLLLLIIVGFLFWALNPLGRPLSERVLSALISSDNVKVTDHNGYISFDHVNRCELIECSMFNTRSYQVNPIISFSISVTSTSTFFLEVST